MSKTFKKVYAVTAGAIRYFVVSSSKKEARKLITNQSPQYLKDEVTVVRIKSKDQTILGTQDSNVLIGSPLHKLSGENILNIIKSSEYTPGMTPDPKRWIDIRVIPQFLNESGVYLTKSQSEKLDQVIFSKQQE